MGLFSLLAYKHKNVQKQRKAGAFCPFKKNDLLAKWNMLQFQEMEFTRHCECTLLGFRHEKNIFAKKIADYRLKRHDTDLDSPINIYV